LLVGTRLKLESGEIAGWEGWFTPAVFHYHSNMKYVIAFLNTRELEAKL